MFDVVGDVWLDCLTWDEGSERLALWYWAGAAGPWVDFGFDRGCLGCALRCARVGLGTSASGLFFERRVDL